MKCWFAMHEKECQSKPQQCKFCSEMVKNSDVNEHLQVCGSKTRECKRCGTFVKVMEKDMHDREGFCDVILESKQELVQKQT